MTNRFGFLLHENTPPEQARIAASLYVNTLDGLGSIAALDNETLNITGCPTAIVTSHEGAVIGMAALQGAANPNEAIITHLATTQQFNNVALARAYSIMLSSMRRP